MPGLKSGSGIKFRYRYVFRNITNERDMKMKDLVIVRGGGDIATGTIYKLYKCGFRVFVLEVEKPSAIRRNVAFSEAVYEGHKTVEDVTCHLAESLEEVLTMLKDGKLTMMVDPKGECINELKPLAVVDAILAKKNLGTNRDMADIVIGLGPGFMAGESDTEADVHAVIETMRGHSLGRIIYEGSAIANTGIPAVVGGFGKERVIKSPAKGILKNRKHIADVVNKGDVIAMIEEIGADNILDKETPVIATIDGILRGMIRDGYPVTEGFKIADIDPHVEELENCFTISDKARCIAGGVLEAILYLKGKKNE